MSDINLETESDEKREETRTMKDNVDEEIVSRKDESTETREYREEEKLRFEQTINLIKEINKKMNSELSEVRREFRQDIEDILWEVKGISEKWENKCMDMKNNSNTHSATVK